MSELGDLLERIFEPRFTCIAAHLSWSIDREGHRRVLERHGGAVVMAMGGPPGATPPATIDAESDLWFHQDGRYRIDQGPAASRFGDGNTQIFLRPGQPALRVEQMSADGLSERLIVGPAVLVANYHLELGDDEVVAGRAGVAVHGRARAGSTAHRLAGFGMWFPETDVADFVFDRATGVLLRLTSRDAGKVVATAALTNVRYDDEVDLSAFDLPPGTVVETEADDLRRRLTDEGVDVSAIDPADIDGLRRALMDHHRSVHGFGRPDARAIYQPTGPPPEDEEDARAQITAAFEGLTDRDDDGRAINIQGGGNLGPSLDRAAERYPGPTTTQVSDVLFLDARHAMVWFHVAVENGPSISRDGSALLVDDRWLATRETIGTLLAMAGIHIPPPE